MPASEVERLVVWSQLRHRIIAFQLEADLPKLTDDSKQELTYIPVFLGGRGPSDSFWQEQRRVVALHDEGLRLDEFILQESARPTRGPTDEEREAQQERELPFLRKLIDLTYEAYRRDWVEQGKEISPAFLLAVRQKVFAAVTLYLMEDEKLTKELLNTSCFHLPVGFAPARLARLLRRLPMSPPLYPRFQATDYINNLVKRMRPEALKLESVGSSLKKEGMVAEAEQARGSPQSSGAVEAQTLTDAVQERHRDKPRKSAKNKYARFWNKRFEGLHPSQMRKTEKYLDKAGLTIAERDCYYLRVGYSKTFAEIASRMGYKHHSTAQEHFEKANAKVDERNS